MFYLYCSTVYSVYDKNMVYTSIVLSYIIYINDIEATKVCNINIYVQCMNYVHLINLTKTASVYNVLSDFSWASGCVIISCLIINTSEQLAFKN